MGVIAKGYRGLKFYEMRGERKTMQPLFLPKLLVSLDPCFGVRTGLRNEVLPSAAVNGVTANPSSAPV